jgi:hypothetical protein
VGLRQNASGRIAGRQERADFHAHAAFRTPVPVDHTEFLRIALPGDNNPQAIRRGRQKKGVYAAPVGKNQYSIHNDIPSENILSYLFRENQPRFGYEPLGP